MGDLTAALRGLTTRGRCLLSAGTVLALCALLLGQRDLLRAAVFLLVLPLAAVAVVSRTRYRLSCTRALDPGRVEAGRPADVHLRLDNVSRLPSGTLLMEDVLPYALGGRPRFVLERVEPHGVREVAYTVRSEVRGRFRVGPLSVRLADPFGLCALTRSFATSDELVVTPVVTPLPAVALGSDGAGGGEITTRAGASSGSDDASTREYRRGDDLRKVHWRSTARTGELMVRQEEQPSQSRAVLLLDTRARAHRGDGPGSSFEAAVAALASIGVALVRSGYALRLSVDDERDLVPPGAPVSEALLLDALAGVEPGEGLDLQASAARLRGGVDGVLVAVLGGLDEEDALRLARLRSGQGRCVAVLLDTPTWGAARPRVRGTAAPVAGSPDAGRVLGAAGWRVVPLARDRSLADVWGGAGRGVPAALRPAYGAGAAAEAQGVGA